MFCVNSFYNSIMVGETIFSTDMYFSQSFNQTFKFDSPSSVAANKIHFIVFCWSQTKSA